MPVRLTRGANTELGGSLAAGTLTVRVAADVSLDVLALLVGDDLRVRDDADLVFWNARRRDGVRWLADGGGQQVEVAPAALPAGVASVLVLLAVPTEGAGGPREFGTVSPLTVELCRPDGGVAVECVLDGLGPEQALVALEIYRRRDRWKVRAVGQGYRGGLADLLRAHGVEVDGDSGGESDGGGAGIPGPALLDGRYVDRAWAVWEDASRSMSAYRSAVEHAAALLDDERAGRAPSGRHGEIVRAARERLLADVTQLTAELDGYAPMLPAPVSPWDSPAWLTWEPGAGPVDGVLVGHLSATELPALRVPLVLRMPLLRPLWLLPGPTSGESLELAWALVTRFLASMPAGSTAVEIVDVEGTVGAAWTAPLPQPVVAEVLAGGVSRGREEVVTRLSRLIDVVDLRSIGADDEATAISGGRPIRLLVVVDAAAAADDPDVSSRLIRLAHEGPRTGVPVLFVETGGGDRASVARLRLLQSSEVIPSVAGEPVNDPWVRGEWAFEPESLSGSAGADGLAVLRHVVAAHGPVGDD